MSLLMALSVWAGGEQWCCAVSKWCPQWCSVAAAPSAPPVHTCLPLSCHKFPWSLLSLQLRDRHSSRSSYRCLPACVPADCRGWGLELYLLSQVWFLQPSDWCQSALPLSCICTSVSGLSLPLLQVQGRWHSKLPIGMAGNNSSKSACGALYSTYKQGGSFGSHPNLISSETKSPYSAGCLPFCNDRKTIIPNYLTSWAQIQQKTCHTYWQGMHCRVTGILWLLVILFL